MSERRIDLIRTEGQPANAAIRELSQREMRDTVGGIWVTVGFFERSYRAPTKHDDDCMSCD
jgi:hypothetical protein